ncbi:MAG: DUF1254 domain-containing protein [Pseudomonadota bacterium]
MKSTVYSIFLGVILAGIIHIVVVLLVPNYAPRDAWSKISAVSPGWQLIRLNSIEGKSDLLPLLDPKFRVAACRFSLDDSALRIQTAAKLPFWSVAVFDRFGKNVYSFNDRTAVENRLDLVVVNPVQMSLVRQDPPAVLDKAVLVEADIDEGFVVVRALAADDTWSGLVETFLTETKCERFEI